MKFLVDDLNGETIEADMIDDMLESFNADDILYVDGIPCHLSTARSLEAEAVKEAAELFVDVMKRNDIADGAESINSWLRKWAT